MAAVLWQHRKCLECKADVEVRLIYSWQPMHELLICTLVSYGTSFFGEYVGTAGKLCV